LLQLYGVKNETGSGRTLKLNSQKLVRWLSRAPEYAMSNVWISDYRNNVI